MKLYDVVAQTFLNLGVDHLFGLMGDANMRFIAAYAESDTGRYVSATHEGGAVAMADGYSRLSGGLGIASITHGPAVTNGLTALTEAVRARSSLLVVTGSTPPQREHVQWLDLRAAARVAGAGFRRVHSPADAAEDLALAARASVFTRRPIVVDLPSEIMSAEVDPPSARCGFGPWSPPAPAPDEEELDAALGVIASADRPVIVAGRGALVSSASEDVVALANLLDAPLATTVLAMGLGRDYPLQLGIFGSESHSLAIRAISSSDCVIVLGAGLNPFTTANGDLLRGKAVVRCDSDPLVLADGDPAWTSVLSDVGKFVRRSVDVLQELGARPARLASSALQAELRDFDESVDFVSEDSPEYVDLRTAMIALDDVLPNRRVLVTDIGRFKTAPWRHLHCDAFTHTQHFGAIGLGLPMAIGASFANPDVPTVAVAGDGGLMMSIAELATAVEHRRRLLLCVANDRSYGAEYDKLQEYGHSPVHSLRPWPSFAAVGEAFGASGEVVRDRDAITQLAPRLAELSMPMVLDIRIDPAVKVQEYR